jgi:hypothetical protein
MNANTTTWIRRIAAGAALAAAPALIALGTAAASNADSAVTGPGYNYSPAPMGPNNGEYPWHGNLPWDQSSFHHRHAAEQQSMY